MRIALVLLLALAVVHPTRASAKQRPIRLNVHAGRVKPGTEKQTCFPITFPRKSIVDVDRVQILVHGGSHHVHLYRPTAGEVMLPNPDNTYSPAGPHNRRPRECAFAIDFSHWELVAASQTSSLNWTLHPGVGIRFEPHQMLMIQTHFVNTGTGSASLAVKGNAHAKMVLYPMEETSVAAHGGALFGQDRTVDVPADPSPNDGVPAISTGASVCHLTGDPSENRPMTVMALTGHYHFRGTRFEVWRTLVDGTRGERVYLNEGYNDPKFQQYAPGELVLAPGEGLEWVCTWGNDTDQEYKFGPNTQKNEHCNLFGFYYPTENPLEAIDCVHYADGTSGRIVAQ